MFAAIGNKIITKVQLNKVLLSHISFNKFNLVYLSYFILFEKCIALYNNNGITLKYNIYNITVLLFC